MSQATELARGDGAGSRWNDLLRFLARDAGVAAALLLIVIFFSLTAPYFATAENFLKIFVQIAINTVLSAGMTFVILTGGIDVGAKREIYELLWALAASGKGIIFVSSDLPELIGTCHRIIVFAHGKIAGEVPRIAFDQHRILSLAYEEYDLEPSN